MSASPFKSVENRSQQYRDGYRVGTRQCAAWLHLRADERDAENTKTGRNAARILRAAAHEMSREALEVSRLKEVGHD